jgi:thiamine-phosphate pyrophosphorylase
MAADNLARIQLARAARRFGRLVLMTDDARLPDPVAAARRLPRGSLIVVRAHDDAKRARLAQSLKTVARSRGLTLLIAGDAALAARIGADGIHLPEARAREASHWRARHPNWIITAAAHSLRVCRGADAVFLSPVFVTGSHPDAVILGAMRARIIARLSPVPVYALGGIDAKSVRRLEGGAFAGVAAISALT